MNRALLITTGIVVILLVIMLWVFLLLNGTPERPQQFFSDLGILPESQPVERTQEFPQDTAEQTALVSISENVLQQLTTEPIAGFGFVANEAYYAEKGTGHLYAIDLTTGVKKQISLTTTQGTTQALFSPRGSTTLLVTNTAVFAAFIPNDPEETLAKVALPSGIENITFIDEDTINYSKSNQKYTVAYTFDVVTKTEEQLFIVEIPDAVIAWGETGDEPLVYQKPTAVLPSALYAIQSGTLRLLVNNKYGLVPFVAKQETIVTALNQTQEYYVATKLSPDGEEQSMGVVMLPEKCAGATTVWCAGPANQLDAAYLENWYKGIISSEDWLWEVTTATGNARLELNLQEAAGRALDVDSLAINQAGTKLLLRNKIDSTLWLYPLQ